MLFCAALRYISCPCWAVLWANVVLRPRERTTLEEVLACGVSLLKNASRASFWVVGPGRNVGRKCFAVFAPLALRRLFLISSAFGYWPRVLLSSGDDPALDTIATMTRTRQHGHAALWRLRVQACPMCRHMCAPRHEKGVLVWNSQRFFGIIIRGVRKVCTA